MKLLSDADDASSIVLCWARACAADAHDAASIAHVGPEPACAADADDAAAASLAPRWAKFSRLMLMILPLLPYYPDSEVGQGWWS